MGTRGGRSTRTPLVSDRVWWGFVSTLLFSLSFSLLAPPGGGGFVLYATVRLRVAKKAAPVANRCGAGFGGFVCVSKSFPLRLTRSTSSNRLHRSTCRLEKEREEKGEHKKMSPFRYNGRIRYLPSWKVQSAVVQSTVKGRSSHLSQPPQSGGSFKQLSRHSGAWWCIGDLLLSPFLVGFYFTASEWAITLTFASAHPLPRLRVKVKTEPNRKRNMRVCQALLVAVETRWVTERWEWMRLGSQGNIFGRLIWGVT